MMFTVEIACEIEANSAEDAAAIGLLELLTDPTPHLVDAYADAPDRTSSQIVIDPKTIAG
jgi:hypothetical protein